MRFGDLVSTAPRALPTGDKSAAAPINTSYPRWLVFGSAAFIATLTVVVASVIHVRAIRVNLAPRWDEAAHSLFGAAIARDLRSADLVALAYDIYRQVYWPPLHSVLVGTAFAAFGERMVVAREVSLVAYVLLPLVLVAAGRMIYPRAESTSGWITGWVAGVLAVATPAFVPYASLAFLELPALLALTLTIAAAFAAEQAPDSPRRRVLVAVGILAAFFLKTNYGLLLMAVFAIDALIEGRFSPRRLLSARNVYILAPVLAVLALWFAYPPKLVSTIRALINQPAGVAPWTIDGLLFYPRALVTLAGSHAMLGILLVGVAGAWRFRRVPNVRLLLMLAGLQFALGEMHHTKADRHILPMMPAMFLLAGVTAARLVRAASREERSTRWRRAASMAALVVAVVAALQFGRLVTEPLPVALPRASVPPWPALDAIIRDVTTAAASGERVLLVSTVDIRPGPPIVDWELSAGRRLLAIDHAGANAEVLASRRIADVLRRSSLPRSIVDPVRRVLERMDAPAPVRTTYAGLPEPLDPQTFAASFRETVRRGEIDLVIVATAVTDSARYPRPYLAQAITQAGLTPVSTRMVRADPPIRLEWYRVARGGAVSSDGPASQSR